MIKLEKFSIQNYCQECVSTGNVYQFSRLRILCTDWVTNSSKNLKKLVVSHSINSLPFMQSKCLFFVLINYLPLVLFLSETNPYHTLTLFLSYPSQILTSYLSWGPPIDIFLSGFSTKIYMHLIFLNFFYHPSNICI